MPSAMLKSSVIEFGEKLELSEDWVQLRGKVTNSRAIHSAILLQIDELQQYGC